MEPPRIIRARTGLLGAKDPVERPVILPTDVCDRCCAQAQTAVRLVSGGLLTLCNHHYDVNAAALVPLTASVVRNKVS